MRVYISSGQNGQYIKTVNDILNIILLKLRRVLYCVRMKLSFEKNNLYRVNSL